jgi:hypothetical protein
MLRLLSITLAVGLAVPCLAYVNGGDFHHTLHKYRDALTAQGWAVAVSEEPKPAAEIKPAEPPPPDPTSQLIAAAVQKLPKEQQGLVALETKRELARIAEEVFKTSRDKKEQQIAEGSIGELKYRLGTYSYVRYWETNYKGGSEGGRRRHDVRSGLGTFVALQMAAAKEKQ